MLCLESKKAWRVENKKKYFFTREKNTRQRASLPSVKKLFAECFSHGIWYRGSLPSARKIALSQQSIWHSAKNRIPIVLAEK